MNFIRKVGHFIKRVVQIFLVLILMILGWGSYQEYADTQAYNATPEGQVALAEKKARTQAEKAESEARARAVRTERAKAFTEKAKARKEAVAEKAKAKEEAVARKLMLKQSREESAALAAKSKPARDRVEARAKACRAKRMKDYSFGKYHFTQSLKDPSSFDQVGFPRKFADSYEITYTATNSYGGRVQSTHSIPVTNCIYK